MKKLLVALLISSCFNAIHTKEQTLTKEDLAKIANKKFHDKAWKNFDKWVFRGTIASAIAYTLSKYVSMRTFDLTPSRLYAVEDQIAQATSTSDDQAKDTKKILPRIEMVVDYTDKDVFPPFKLNLKNQSFFNNWFAHYEKNNTKHTLFLSKPHLVKTFFAMTIALGLTDLAIKMKRASDHGSNLFMSFWA